MLNACLYGEFFVPDSHGHLSAVHGHLDISHGSLYISDREVYVTHKVSCAYLLGGFSARGVKYFALKLECGLLAVGQEAFREARVSHGIGRDTLGKEHVVLGVENVYHAVALGLLSKKHASQGVDTASLQAERGTHRNG